MKKEDIYKIYHEQLCVKKKNLYFYATIHVGGIVDHHEYHILFIFNNTDIATLRYKYWLISILVHIPYLLGRIIYLLQIRYC
jgi:hypothetical protein